MSKDAHSQAIDFFIKRAEYSATLATQHCKDTEYEKGMNLFKEAYGYLKKAENAHPDDENLKKKIDEIRQKYQDAKKKFEEKQK
jgi:hypothetical protein